MCTPNGNCVWAAPTRAAVPAVVLRNVRRLMLPVLLGPLVIFVDVLWLASLVRTASCAQHAGTKKPQPASEALFAFPPGQRRCLVRPAIGPPRSSRTTPGFN